MDTCSAAASGEPSLPMPQTPPSSRPLPNEASGSTPVLLSGRMIGRFRRGRLRRQALPSGIAVLDPNRSKDDCDMDRELALAAGEMPIPMLRKRGPANHEEMKRRYTYRRLKRGCNGEISEDEAALEQIPSSFAEQYFMSALSARPVSGDVCRAAAACSKGGTAEGIQSGDQNKSFREWLGNLQLGFSLLVHGLGSKWQLLENFADSKLVPWGANVVRISGFDASFSMADCLRDVLEQVFPTLPRTSNSIEALSGTIRGSLQASAVPARPLCFVVHNLESLSPAHQTLLAGLVSTPGVHLVASVDNIWAPLAWSPDCAKNFNFCREEFHTFEGYDLEHAMRFSRGPPAWSDPSAARQKAPKASLGLVLRSLTRSHRELVQALAERQLASGCRSGLSQSQLLVIAADRMIASTTAKLRSLLNELKDHEVVAQKNGADGGIQLYLNCEEKILKRLAEGLEPDQASDQEAEDGKKA